MMASRRNKLFPTPRSLPICWADLKERVAWVGLKAVLRGSAVQRIGSIEVVHGIDGTDGPHIQKLKEAADLVRESDPRRYGMIEANLCRIAIVDWNVQGARYYALSRTLVLRAESIEFSRVSVLASMLVHEATHGRISSWGIRYTPQLSERIEQLCLRNEVWFLQRVPGAQSLLDLKKSDWLSAKQ